uniref:ATP-binding protein n=1 Tax=candidate division WOR-3 bacterium TaxID=2052148 RepID=A0A7C6ECK3_UNCW3
MQQNLKNTYLNLSNKLVKLLELRVEPFKDYLHEELTAEISSNEAGKDNCQFARLEQYREKIAVLNKKMVEIEKQLEEIRQLAKATKVEIPFEILAEKYSLGNEERLILLTLFFSEIDESRYSRDKNGRDLLWLLGFKPIEFVPKSELFRNLLENKLITISQNYYRHRPKLSNIAVRDLLDVSYHLNDKIFEFIAGNSGAKRHSQKPTISDSDFDLMEQPTEQADPDSNLMEQPTQQVLIALEEPILTLDQIVLDKDKQEAIERIIFQIKEGNRIFAEFGVNETIKYGKGTVILFYGPPGTGKTATAHGIAHKLGKKIVIVNYATILDKYVGESEKNIRKLFKDVREKDCVLVFDEADALFGRRITERHSTDRLHNYMTNILMQELERFEGAIILTTNREAEMDEAFARRILFKLNFDIPGPKERAKIWQSFFTEKTPLADDVNFEELGEQFELTGGEIKNVVEKAVIELGYQGMKKITMASLVKFAQEELVAVIRKRKRKTDKLGF